MSIFSAKENLSLAIYRLEEASVDLVTAIQQLGDEPSKLAVAEDLERLIETVRVWRSDADTD